MKSISFLLPSPSKGPTGGVKVAIEYANRFARDGYEVHVVYPLSLSHKPRNIKEQIRVIMYYTYYRLTGYYSVRRWRNLNPNIKEHLSLSLNQRNVPSTNVYIATAVTTAQCLNTYTGDVKKIHFIQDHEIWIADESTLMEVYHYKLDKIVISNWLKKLLDQIGQESTLIYNGFDFDYFRLTKPIETRDKYTVAMLYHFLEKKGVEDGFRALEIVKSHYPQLRVKLFGAYGLSKKLPSWYEYTRYPNKERHNSIYNDSAIFLATSLYEGWGLTVGEAMMCGCAVVCTDNKGYKEMAVDNENSLMVPVGDYIGMANAIIKLIEDDNLRFRIAQKGVDSIKRFDWESSYYKFKAVVER